MKTPMCSCHKEQSFWEREDNWWPEDEGYHITGTTMEIEFDLQYQGDEKDRLISMRYLKQEAIHFCPVCGTPYQ